MPNTGRAIYTRLLKVSDDEFERPLDADNNLVSESGKPQQVKLNTLNEEGYIPPEMRPDLCPLN